MTDPVHNKKTVKNMLRTITFSPFTLDPRIFQTPKPLGTEHLAVLTRSFKQHNNPQNPNFY